MSNFYMVESSVSAAVWQVDPQGIVRQLQLKSKIGCFGNFNRARANTGGRRGEFA